jgi:hypothetical protein
VIMPYYQLCDVMVFWHQVWVLLGFTNFVGVVVGFEYRVMRYETSGCMNGKLKSSSRNSQLNCKSFYNRTANHLITIINYSIISSHFIAPLL